jgi:hypothetical protein
MTYEEQKAAERAPLTVRELILEHGINPIEVTGLDKWSHLEVALGKMDNHLEVNGIIVECADGTRLWLQPSSRDGKHFTIDAAPWNLTEGGPYGPFIDTTCRPWEDMEPPMSEYDWLKTYEYQDYLRQTEPAAQEPAATKPEESWFPSRKCN